MSSKYIIRNSFGLGSGLGLGLTKKVSISMLFLITLSVVMVYYILKHSYEMMTVKNINVYHEGFDNASSKNFLMKNNNTIFDTFYSTIYDMLVYSDSKNDFELSILKTASSPITKQTKILDVGSGTGHHVGEIINYFDTLNSDNVVGVDISKAMVEKSRENFPEYKTSFIEANIMKQSLFNDNLFTHITCLYFTIYYIKDKYRFFKNCYNWLQNGGVLLLHMVNRDQFDPIIPAGNPLHIINVQNYSKKRITESKVSFNGFDYQSRFNIKPNEDKAFFIEDFIFKNGKTRRNEHTLYMESQEAILNIAKQAGFTVKSRSHMYKCGFEKQYLYVLEKNL